MAVEPKAITRDTVKMKFVGHFKGTSKIVQLPIPLLSNSQRLDTILNFTRQDNSHGPAFCDVPLEWAGALLAVGGSWQAAEKISPDLQARIDEAKEQTDKRMKTFAEENNLVEA